MPTQLGEAFSPLWRGKYPHMLTEDFPVWERYLNKHGSLFERIYYDVRLGGIVLPETQANKANRDMYFNVTAKRIDALAELKDEIWIIEVASNPGLRATGQLLTYMALWFEDPKINKKALGVLVCQTLDADLGRALTFHGMRQVVAD